MFKLPDELKLLAENTLYTTGDSSFITDSLRDQFAAAVVHDCIAVVEHCKTGAAMEVGGKQYPLGIMAVDPAEAQRLTAVAIAQAIRCRYGLGE